MQPSPLYTITKLIKVGGSKKKKTPFHANANLPQLLHITPKKRNPYIGFSIPPAPGVLLGPELPAALPDPPDPRPRFIIRPRIPTNSAASSNISSSIPSTAL